MATWKLEAASEHHPLKLNFLTSEINQEPHFDSRCFQFVEELRFIRVWFQLGVRMMHLTYNRRNVIGDGCGEVGVRADDEANVRRVGGPGLAQAPKSSRGSTAK